MGDLFAPCNFTNIPGYPYQFPDRVGKAIDELPLFQGNNAETHLKNFSHCMSKYRPYTDYEDVKMKLFVLLLENDALDWFWEFPDNTFYSFKSIIDALEKKYDRHPLKNKNEPKKS